MELHQKRSMPNYQKLKTMEHKSETSITKFRHQKRTRIETGAVVTSRRRLGGIEKRKRNLLSVEKQKVSVREETNAVSDTRVMIVQNRHQKPLHPLSHQHQEVEVRREKGASEAEASLGSPTDSLQKLIERYLH